MAEDLFYGKLPTEQERTYGAVRGMIESFKDPYTVFIEPPQTELQSQQAQRQVWRESARVCGARTTAASCCRRFPIGPRRRPV